MNSELDQKPSFLKSLAGNPGTDRLDRGMEALKGMLAVNEIIFSEITPTTTGLFTVTVIHNLGYRFLSKARFTDTDGGEVSFGISDLSNVSMWFDDITEGTMTLAIINGVVGHTYPVTVVADVNEMI